MIKLYCDSQHVTDEVFKKWYGINDNKLDELKGVGLSVGYFVMTVDKQKINFYVVNTKKNEKSGLLLKDKPSVLIKKQPGRRKFMFTDCIEDLSACKSFKLIFRIEGINYTLCELCEDIGISEFHLKKSIRGLKSCKINGVSVFITRKPKNSAYYNLIRLNSDKEFLNQTGDEARSILKCTQNKLSALGTGYHQAKINGYQVIRHNGENI